MPGCQDARMPGARMPGCQGDREGRPYPTRSSSHRLTYRVGATLAVALASWLLLPGSWPPQRARRGLLPTIRAPQCGRPGFFLPAFWPEFFPLCLILLPRGRPGFFFLASWPPQRAHPGAGTMWHDKKGSSFHSIVNQTQRTDDLWFLRLQLFGHLAEVICAAQGDD